MLGQHRPSIMDLVELFFRIHEAAALVEDLWEGL